MSNPMNRQEVFWSKEYSSEYMKRNSIFDIDSGIKAWAKMTQAVPTLESILECGSNIGRNIAVLNHLYPSASKSIIELSEGAFKVVTNRYRLLDAFNSSILEADLADRRYELVFTSGVLIHIAPENLMENLKKIYSASSKYILFCEMFSRNPAAVPYRGGNDLLFTRDYGRLFLESFNVEVVDYGFLWGHFYDNAGFDDAHYWLFKKMQSKT